MRKRRIKYEIHDQASLDYYKRLVSVLAWARRKKGTDEYEQTCLQYKNATNKKAAIVKIINEHCFLRNIPVLDEAKIKAFEKVLFLRGNETEKILDPDYKKKLYVSQDRRCFICGEMITEEEYKSCQFDHYIPQEVGGEYLDTEFNVHVVHKECNEQKGASILPIEDAALAREEINKRQKKKLTSVGYGYIPSVNNRQFKYLHYEAYDRLSNMASNIIQQNHVSVIINQKNKNITQVGRRPNISTVKFTNCRFETEERVH